MKTGGHRLVPMSLTPVDSRNSMGFDRVMVRNIMIGTNKRASQGDEHKVSDLQIPLSSPHGRRADGSHYLQQWSQRKKALFPQTYTLELFEGFFIHNLQNQATKKSRTSCLQLFAGTAGAYLIPYHNISKVCQLS